MHISTIVLSILGFDGLTRIAAQSSVASYVESEGPVAKAGMLANIGPNGSKSSGAKSGVVIASPSTTNPDYLYSWIRDSSLVFKSIIDQFALGLDSSLESEIGNFIAAEANLQQVSNPSGSISTGGLGEPKFNIDETAFTGAWGRPQRDGPALRATAMIAYANWLIKNSELQSALNNVWPLIKLDLDYVSLSWNLTTFDLWEELDSSSFFTTAVQHRALREGYALAETLGVTSSVSSYPTAADDLLCFLQSYWNPSGSYITANTGGGRSGIDANTILASIHTFDIQAGCDAATFQPCSDKALANLLTYVNSFRDIYAINSGIALDEAVATGRYPEDVYMNGNPWYLTTFAVAEQLYDALNTWAEIQLLEVTSTSLPFFQIFDSSITVGSYSSSSTAYTTLTSAIRNYADGFIAIAAKYTPSNGGLSEQFSKDDGSPLSAADLTWSYASAVTVFEARNSTAFPSWGAKGLSIPEECLTQSGGSGNTIPVTFNVEATTNFGENIYITGSADALAIWSTDEALLLSSANYPNWSITVNLPPNTIVQYKYIRKDNDVVTWESDPNNQFTTPASGGITEQDTWR